jgi:hypothetical protein
MTLFKTSVATTLESKLTILGVQSRTLPATPGEIFEIHSTSWSRFPWAYRRKLLFASVTGRAYRLGGN